MGIVTEYPEYFASTPLREIWNLVKVNIEATLFMTRIILPQMLKQRKGAIINISSGSEIVPLPFHCVYSASKVHIP